MGVLAQQNFTNSTHLGRLVALRLRLPRCVEFVQFCCDQNPHLTCVLMKTSTYTLKMDTVVQKKNADVMRCKMCEFLRQKKFLFIIKKFPISARYSSEVLQMFYGPITRGQNRNVPQPLEPDVVEIDDIFILARRNNFQEWLRVWKMVVSRRNVNNNDLLAFARENKEKFTNVVENEIKELNSVKVSFGMKAEFSIIRNDERQTNTISMKTNHTFSTETIRPK